VVFFAAFPVLSLVFYRGPGWLLPIVWVPMIFALTGGSTIARALATELFPTSHRGTASGWLQLTETLGAAAGLFAVSWLTIEGESAIPAVELVSFSVLLAAVAVVALPETGRRELEEISAER
jgi:MFS family permease